MKDYGRREETAKVKEYLIKQGYRNVTVGHGKGTAWGWLRVSVTISRPENCQCHWFEPDQWGRRESCHICKRQWQDEYSKVGGLTREITGRHGEYGGNVNYDITQEDQTQVVPKPNSVLQTILAEV